MLSLPRLRLRYPRMIPRPSVFTVATAWIRRIAAGFGLIGILGSVRSAAEPSGVAAHDFAPRSGPRGATMFTTLTPEQTGVTAINRYDDPKMWRERYREFSLGAIGTGIAIGDYDGDGKPDIFVVCKAGENHLFHNLGNFKFEDVTAKAGVAGPTGAWKQGASFVDVNNDGRLDLYVCRFGAANLLYINQGDGTFKEEAGPRGLAVVDSSGQAAWCDYDRDGFLDVYLQTNVLDGEGHPNGQRDYLFHNNGDGTFTNVTDRAGITGETQGHSATWWDYNEDGWPDLYIANDFKDPDQLYRNNGDGTFTNVLSWVVPHTPHSSMGADLGDVNNDGHLDLIVADMAATSRIKDHRGMAKVRAGLPETDSTPNAAPQYMRNALFLNLGVNRMLEGAFLAGLDATDWTWTVRLEDLDCNGWVDPYFTNGMVRELHNADLVGRMSKLENLDERTLVMKNSPPLAERNLVFRNHGDLQFENVSAAWGLDHLGVSFGAAFGDLDGDGDLDLVFANYDGEVTVCRNDLDTGHRVVFELRGAASNRFGIGSIVRIETDAGVQARPLLIARGYLSSSEPVAHFGLGSATTIRRVTIQWPSGIIQTLENLPADRRYTIKEPDAKPANLPQPERRDAEPKGQFADVSAARNLAIATKERPFNELARQPLLALRLNRIGPSAAAADLDGDGIDDLCLGGPMGDAPRFLSNLGDGNFLPYGNAAFSDRTQTADANLLFFDADGDGDNDLLVTKGGDAKEAGSPAYQPRLYSNDGHGQFTPAEDDALPPLSISAGAAAAADFDRDGKLDVFIGGRIVPGQYPTTPESVLLHNAGGRFVDVTDSVAPALRRVGMVTSAIWSDVDGDGWLDLVLTLDWGTVKYFHNDQGKTFTDASTPAGFAKAGAGWWTSIASADFNGDGRPDFVVGNVGLNTRYRASTQRPAVLFYGAFDASGRKQLVEAQYEGDALYPVRGLPQLAAAIPEIGRKFTSFDAFAKLAVEQLFSSEKLAAAQRLEATEFQSGVFLSQPDGTYRFQALPRLAQLAPIYGLAAGDFDGDGHADIVFAQNSFAPIPEVSRFDGGFGLLLRGDGHGSFSIAAPSESGVVITGDAKALVVTDFDQDGWPDLFVTRNNGKTLALRNQAIAGRHSFAVMLRGPAGNPSAIGARVTVTLRDGSTQTAEVRAGSGYLSQSTCALFFGFVDGNPPTTLSVRWPDGHASTHPWQNESKRILLTPSQP